MRTLIVVESPKNWSLDIPGTEVVAAKQYLTQRRYIETRRCRIFNLCRSYAYQSVGYYVSLLATARGHKPLPSVTTLQDLKTTSVQRVVSEDIEGLLQRLFAPLKSSRFSLSIYFGRNLSQRYDRLCQALFNHFPAPLLRAEFVRADEWRLHSLRPIAANDIPASHHEFVAAQAQRFFARRTVNTRSESRFDLAILVNRDEVDAPSDAKAIERFVRAARQLKMSATVIEASDFGRLAEFDGLFIRETTAVNHHTYRFASRAEAEGLVVIDDPESIVRCTNKVYQAEAFKRFGVPMPETIIVHRDNVNEVVPTLGLPCVLKQPDSSFSQGVLKAGDEAELANHLKHLLNRSELVVAQKYLPSSFDWRIGVLEGKPLYACRYHMARGHWQIQKPVGERQRRYGKVETLAVEEAPREAVRLATRASGLMGSGLYGVDIKEIDGKFFVIEVNDNPSIEAHCEDLVLKQDLYLAIMRVFCARLEQRSQLAPSGNGAA